MGMVKRECEKKSRQKAVRQLLAESRTLVPSLKPCFLMSPLSVAQYLPVDAEPFDLIVFDEASQIPVWDAIGVIARGRQLIVAVTRAKEQVVVFSSIHASQIDAGEDGRTKAVGAGHLKAFLEYAERGNAVAAPAHRPNGRGRRRGRRPRDRQGSARTT